MRITKVKVNNKDVTMQRDNQEGFLKFGDVSHKEQEVLSFVQSKKADFIKSVMGKTLVKPDNFDKTTDKILKQTNLKELTKIFDFILSNKQPKVDNTFDIATLKKLEKEDLKAYLNHKFHQKCKYGPKHKVIYFNLIENLHQALTECNTLQSVANKLSDYNEWQKWHIEQKQYFSAKSIINNKIDYTKNDSPRKQVLNNWAKKKVRTPEIDLIQNLAHEFNLTTLCVEWASSYVQFDKWTQSEIDHELKEFVAKLTSEFANHPFANVVIAKKKAEKEEDLKKNKLGSPKNPFEFKRNLKELLRKHQRDLYKNNLLLSGSELSQYSIEVSKYLMHYFPLKKSKRRLTKAYIDHYLDEQNINNYLKNNIDNAIVNYLLQQGKALYYQFDDQINSEKLQQIKSQEAFALQFLDVCAFAGNNLRNCIDTEIKSDLLSKDVLTPAYNALADKPFELAQSKYNLARFFTTLTINTENFTLQNNHKEIVTYFQQSNDEYKNFVAAVRSAISNIRNEVFHFKTDALNKILAIKDFEILETDGKKNNKKAVNINYQGSFLETCFKKEIHNLPNLWCEKLKSAGLFDFYEPNDLAKHFIHFDLCSKPLAFVPGFKTIFKWGIKYKEDNQYPLGLGDTYFRKTLDNVQSEIDPAKQARYNAMAIIYEQQFIHYFTDNNERQNFNQVVNTVLQANNEKNNNKHAHAFKEILPPAEHQSVQDYLKNIQSQLIQEENKKRDDDPNFSAQETGHFQQFLWQVFMKGFDTYIQQTKFAYLSAPNNKINANNQNNAEQSYQRNTLACDFLSRYGIKTTHDNINIQSGEQIAFWTLCKMLDANHLNELLNQMTKWQQAADKLNIKESINSAILACQEIIQLCLLSVDRISGNWQSHYNDDNGEGKNQYFITLKPYLADKFEPSLKGVFVQEDGSPIIFAPVEMAKKYATENIIKQSLKNSRFKLSKKNIEDWQKQKEAQSCDNPADLARNRQDLHNDWLQNKQKKLKNWLKNNASNYQSICKKIEQYNWIDNKVHLIHIHRLHHLLMQILGRMVGFVALFERDFYFLTKSLNQHLTPVFEPTDLTFWRSSIKHKNFYYSLFVSDVNKDNNNKNNKEFLSDWNWKDHRNYIVHFNYLGQSFEPNSPEKVSILKLITNVRDLVSYDRKLKNAIAKSFIDLLDKHGIVVKFEPLHENQHQFVINDIKSKQIEHLGGAVKIDQHPQEYIDMVRALLELGEKPKVDP